MYVWWWFMVVYTTMDDDGWYSHLSGYIWCDTYSLYFTVPFSVICKTIKLVNVQSIQSIEREHLSVYNSVFLGVEWLCVCELCTHAMETPTKARPCYVYQSSLYLFIFQHFLSSCTCWNVAEWKFMSVAGLSLYSWYNVYYIRDSIRIDRINWIINVQQ